MDELIIKDIPDLPQEIINAINQKKLAVFIGAGVSRILGCKGWDSLAKDLVECCYNESKNNSSESIITFKEKESLNSLFDHRKVITICHKLLRNEKKEEKFYEIMETSLLYKSDLIRKPNIYDDLSQISAVFVTTNADEHFDYNFSPSMINVVSSGNIPLSDSIYKLVHIHGSINDRSSLIFTLPQYFSRYSDQSFQRYLGILFSNYTVLFLGYGLSEFELLEHLFRNKSEQKEVKHFLLGAYYRGEENILALEQCYYEEMGIQIKPFLKDRLGYYQLENVIKSWVKEINDRTMQISDRLREIDDAVI